MTSKLDVTVAVDPGPGTITITPIGKLTPRNVQGLLPVALRARSIAPGFSLVVDLGELAGADTAAVQLLRSGCPQTTRILGITDTAQPGSVSPLHHRPQRTAVPGAVAA